MPYMNPMGYSMQLSFGGSFEIGLGGNRGNLLAPNV